MMPVAMMLAWFGKDLCHRLTEEGWKTFDPGKFGMLTIEEMIEHEAKHDGAWFEMDDSNRKTNVIPGLSRRCPNWLNNDLNPVPLMTHNISNDSF